MTEYLAQQIDWDVAAWYDELPLWSAPFGLLLLRYVPLRPGMVVLDVGCGTGFPLVELAQRLGSTCRVCGLDRWQAALGRARQRISELHLGNAAVVTGDAAAMPFAGKRFDLIVSNLGINNFQDPGAAFAECARVLKPDGRIALTTNLRGHMGLFYECFHRTLEELGRRHDLPALRRHIDHRTTTDEIGRLLKQADMEICRAEEESFVMRFLDGSALLRHTFIRLGFLDGWRGIVPQAEQGSVFRRLEENLNAWAAEHHGLELSVPIAYVEARKSR